MHSLYIYNETFTNGLNSNFLNFISLAAIFCGIFVIISKNPIVSVLYLIGLFLSMSGYLMMLGINFIGLSYLLVYVGAVSILFLFILMLINVRVSELVTETSNSLPLAIIIGIIFYTTLYDVLPLNRTLHSTSLKGIVGGNVNNTYSAYPSSFSINMGGTQGKDNQEISFVTSQM